MIFVNAGIFLFRDHYIIKRRDCRAWDVFPADNEGVTLRRVKSQADAKRRINGFYASAKRYAPKQKNLF